MVAGIPQHGRWSRDIGTAGPGDHSKANGGKRLNDDCRQEINHNYHHVTPTKDPENVCGGISGAQSVLVMYIIHVSPSELCSPRGQGHCCVNCCDSAMFNKTFFLCLDDAAVCWAIVTRPF